MFMRMTKSLHKYIKNNNLSSSAISNATGVDEKLLTDNPPRALNASELLELCQWLEIEPKELWDK